ncbi:MAG: hypothetical protein OEZ04_13530, partial [Nitrospinota bacterium]|nr:hypothetical protein [Nitrospinota bacterium]
MAGSYVNQNEFGNIDLLRDGQEYWLTLDDFIKMAGIRFEKKGDFLEFVTPIGAARLPKESMGEFDGRSYISAELLLEKFNIQATFSQMDYAIILDIPWRPGAPLADEVGDEAELDVVKPDIRSTAGALGFFRAQGDMKQDSNVDTDAWNGTADMGGRLVGGTWFLGARGARGLDPWLDRYFWNREFEKSVVRLGFHNIQLHSFFTSHQFNGAQWAYNNMGIAPYTDFSGSNTLESMLQEDSGENINIIRHDGHPGGIAELRINDRTVAYARVGLDGRYEFLDIRKSGWGLLSVKVLLYKRSISEVPTAVVDLTRMQAAQSLKMGELMIRAGLGRIRNPQVVVPSQVKEYGVGFLHGRYGFTENVTLLGAAQNRSEDEIESLAGLRISLGKHWAWSVDAASHDGTMAYSSELRGMDKNWEFWLRNLRMENGYGVNIVTIDNGYIETEEHDHYMQSLYQVFDSFKIGLFGRDAKRRLVEDIKYVLPGFYFTPGYSLSLSAVPNLDGEYRVSGLYSLASDKRLSLIFENHQYNVSLYYDMSPRHNFTAVYEYNDITRDTIGLVNFYWFFHQTNQSHLNLGVSHNTGYPGLVAGL